MPAELITTDDLREFKSDLLQDLKEMISNYQSDLTKEWLRSSEVEKMLKLSPNKLYQMRVNNEIPYYRFGKTIYYKHQDIVDNMKLMH